MKFMRCRAVQRTCHRLLPGIIPSVSRQAQSTQLLLTGPSTCQAAFASRHRYHVICSRVSNNANGQQSAVLEVHSATATDIMASEQVTDNGAKSAFVGQALLDALDDDKVWQGNKRRRKPRPAASQLGPRTQVAHHSTVAKAPAVEIAATDAAQNGRTLFNGEPNAQSSEKLKAGKKKGGRMKKGNGPKKAKSPSPGHKSPRRSSRNVFRRVSPDGATSNGPDVSTETLNGYGRYDPRSGSYQLSSNDVNRDNTNHNGYSTITNHRKPDGSAASNAPSYTPTSFWAAWQQSPIQALQYGLMQQFQYHQSPPSDFFLPSNTYPQYAPQSDYGSQTGSNASRNYNSGATSSSSVQPQSAANSSQVELPVRTRMTTRAMNALPVPTPTPAYFFQASQPRRAHSAGRQKLLLILDLNGTLVYRHKSSKSVKPRQHVADFLRYILANHSIMIWSSATPGNVEKMVQSLFTPEMRATLIAQWARDRLGLSETQMQNKVQVYKQLSWVWADAQVQTKQSGIPFSQSNTVLIDDSMLKASAEPFNLVQIPEFDGHEEADDVLGQVTAYIDWLGKHEDVSAAIADRKFKINDGWQWNWKQS